MLLGQTPWTRFAAVLVIFAGFILTACGNPTNTDVTTPVAPSAPTILSINSGPGYVDIAWEHDGSDTDTYQVYRAEAAASSARAASPFITVANVGTMAFSAGDVTSLTAGEWQPAGSASSTDRSYRDTGATEGASYFYAVTARNADGAESALPEASGEPAIVEPTGNPPGANPDPSRYLAIIVKNFIGNGVEGVDVHVALLPTDGSHETMGYTSGVFVTDASGVAVVTDEEFEELFDEPFVAAGEYHVSVFVDYKGLSPTAAVSVIRNMTIPGTIVIDPLADGFWPVELSVHDGGRAVEAAVQVVAPIDDMNTVMGFVRLHHRTVYFAAGSYQLMITQRHEPDPFSLTIPVTIDGAKRVRFDAAEQTDVVTFLTPLDTNGINHPVSWYASYLWRAGDGWSEGMNFGTAGPTSRWSPGLYRYSAILRMVTVDNELWLYSLAPSVEHNAIDLDLSTPGATVEYPIGGQASVNLVHNPVRQYSPELQTSYQTGDRVYFLARVYDAYDNIIRGVFPTAVCSLNVRDPSETEVLTVTADSQVLLRGATDASHVIAPDAPRGTYTVRVTCDLGPYDSSVTGETTFIVE